MNCFDWKTVSEIFESLLTGLAIVIGGFWTYNKFIKKRESYPRALLRHKVENRILNDDKRLIHLCVEIENIGDVIVSLVAYDVRIYQILPLHDKVVKILSSEGDPIPEGERELPWPLLFTRQEKLKKGVYEIEPQEKHVFHYDFVVDKNICTIQTYSHIKNEAKPKREIGWECEQFHELN